jgi:hypothetical protein
MSPPPRRNPAAFEYVGAAATAVAANAPSKARRETLEEDIFVMSALSRRLPVVRIFTDVSAILSKE